MLVVKRRIGSYSQCQGSPTIAWQILIEMCVVTGAQAGKIMEAESCRENPGFTGLPNVVGWAEMSLTSNSAEWTNLALERGQTYVVVMRIFYNDGSSAYTNSDGVTVVPEELVSKLSEKKDVKRLGERSVNVERALGASVVSTLQVNFVVTYLTDGRDHINHNTTSMICPEHAIDRVLR